MSTSKESGGGFACAAPGLVAVALLVFLAVSTGIRRLVPWPADLGLAAKMEYFEAHKDEFDTLFVGSSHVVRGVDNQLIERLLATRGIEMHSFNFGVGGARSFEQDFILHHLLGLRPARLKWVFYEGMPLDPRFRETEGTWTFRNVRWHTPRQTLLADEAILRRDLPLAEKLELLGEHQVLFAWWLANYGLAPRIAAGLWPSDEELRLRAGAIEAVAKGQGYQSMEDLSGRPYATDVEALLEDPTPFEERMAAIPAENAAPQSLDRIPVRAVRDLYAATAATGAELVYFVPPGIEGTPERPFLHEEGVIPVLFDFNHPELYPNLFRLDRRFNMGHLNRRGTIEFSELLGNAIGDYLQERREP